METIWLSQQLASTICSLIETTEFEGNPNMDLAELKGTVHTVRSTLVSFLKKYVNDPAFDVCIQGIKESLERCEELLTELIRRNCFDVSRSSDTATSSLPIGDKMNLYRLDFLINHQLMQLDVLFPKSSRASAQKLIDDVEGRLFWTRSFKDDALMVPWEIFMKSFKECFPNEETIQEREEDIKLYLDFTRDGLVSLFEFSTFLAWFGPLTGSVQRLMEPLDTGMLCGFLPACEANHLLKDKPPGSYLLRFSKSQLKAFALTFVDGRCAIKHCLLYCAQPSGVTLRNPTDVHPGLKEFVAAHPNKLRTPLNKKWQTDDTTSKGIKQTHSAGELGTRGPDKEFTPKHNDICVVCMDGLIDTVFLECGHLGCCKPCALQLTHCPICRARVERVVSVYRA
eukprot:TRINITY_DN12663_c0_g1_i1.p1 TRINITY_DN12663_c0_g1~~TRINITY_DN12663_c0_g1_i1.p1  ORF type:complete len:397 (+),score=56.29 TRINITY_DN12663_c0_g1_i1:371-1561(+)